MKQSILLLGLFSLLVLSSCSKKACADPEANNFNNEGRVYDNSTCTYDPVDESIYTRVGGIEGVSLLVDEFLANVLTDQKINQRFFPTVNSTHRYNLLRLNLIDQLCEATGGPCQYKGKSMFEAHKGMNITKEEFNALVLDLINAMKEINIGDHEQGMILQALAPMEEDIIGN